MTTATEMQAVSMAWAREFVEETKAAISDTVEAVNDIGFDPVGYAYVNVKDYVEPTKLVMPKLDNVNFVEPSEPDAPDGIVDPANLVFDSIPDFDITAPTFTSPVKPSAIATFNEQAPEVIVDAAFPEVPSQLLSFDFEMPTIPDRDTPIKPNIAIPSFDEVAPVDNVGSIGNLSSQFQAGYASAVPSMLAKAESEFDSALAKINPRYSEAMEKIEQKLSAYLDGGTALNPAVENAIYERGRAKLTAEYLRAVDVAEKDSASRGFPMPPGALIAARMNLRKAAGDNNAMLAREVAINQANMEQENLKFAVTTSAQVRSTVVNSALQHEQGAIQIIGLAIDFGKTIVDSLLKAYNAQIERYRISLDAYKTKAGVFETRMRAVSAAIDIYKAEIDALQSLTNVDRAKIESFNSKVNSLRALGDVYKTQVDAVVSKAQLEKLKIDVFKIKAEIYQTQMQAKNAEWQGFDSELRGEEAKQRVFETQLRSYQVKLTASETKMKMAIDQVQAQLQKNDGIYKQYDSKVKAFNSIVSARAEIAKVGLENQRQKVLAFQMEAQTSMAESDARAKYYQAVNLVALENARMFSNREIKQAELSLRKTEAIANGIGHVGAAYQGAAGAAMSGMVNLAGIIEKQGS